MRKVKCMYCKDSDTKDNLHCYETLTKKKDDFGLTIEKKVCKYYHIQCKEKHEKNVELENQLFGYLMKLYGFKLLPKKVIVFIRQYKTNNNIDYDLIINAYKISDSSIQYVLKNKEFNNDFNMFKYTWAIVESNINKVYKQKVKEKSVNSNGNATNDIFGIEVEYQQKNDINDISAFLD